MYEDINVFRMCNQIRDINGGCNNTVYYSDTNNNVSNNQKTHKDII